MAQYAIPLAVGSARFYNDEPAYCVPFASYNYPNNPIPSPPPIPPPTAPTALNATNITSSSFTINWTPGLNAQSYVITWGSYTFSATAPVTSFTLTGLPPITTNLCYVTAHNSSGSAISAPLSVTTGSLAPAGIQVSNITGSSFDVSWTYVPGTTYTLTWGSYNGTVTGNGTGTFTGLPGNTQNSLTVFANGTGSQPILVLTAPGAITGFTVTRRGVSYLNFSFNQNTSLSYSVQMGTYTGSVYQNGTAAVTLMPVGYTGNVVMTATNPSGSTQTNFGSQTLLTPQTYDTGVQNQTSPATGFYLAPLTGTITVPLDFDIVANGVQMPGYASLPTNFVTVNAGFDYTPVASGGLFALRFTALNANNPQGAGSSQGDEWQNEIACHTTGNATEFQNLTSFQGTNGNWQFIPGDTIFCYLLIAYDAWEYQTYSIFNPQYIQSFWRCSFTYNPFTTS